MKVGGPHIESCWSSLEASKQASRVCHVNARDLEVVKFRVYTHTHTHWKIMLLWGCGGSISRAAELGSPPNSSTNRVWRGPVSNAKTVDEWFKEPDQWDWCGHHRLLRAFFFRTTRFLEFSCSENWKLRHIRWFRSADISVFPQNWWANKSIFPLSLRAWRQVSGVFCTEACI